MTDLVDRLRKWVHAVHAVPVSDLMDEAADEIERLRHISSRREPAVALLLERIDSSQRTLAFEQEAEIERLKSRLRFCDAVIRSGDVATLTDAEQEAVEAAIAGLEAHAGPRDYGATKKILRGLLERLSQPAT